MRSSCFRAASTLARHPSMVARSMSAGVSARADVKPPGWAAIHRASSEASPGRLDGLRPLWKRDAQCGDELHDGRPRGGALGRLKAADGAERHPGSAGEFFLGEVAGLA